MPLGRVCASVRSAQKSNSLSEPLKQCDEIVHFCVEFSQRLAFLWDRSRWFSRIHHSPNNWAKRFCLPSAFKSATEPLCARSCRWRHMPSNRLKRKLFCMRTNTAEHRTASPSQMPTPVLVMFWVCLVMLVFVSATAFQCSMQGRILRFWSGGDPLGGVADPTLTKRIF